MTKLDCFSQIVDVQFEDEQVSWF